MKNAGKVFAQGDVIFLRVEELPESLVEVPRDEKGRLVTAHSETGHHHAIDGDDARLFQEPNDPLVAYLSVEGGGVELVHHRPVDTHAPIHFPAGIWKVSRQQEYTPEGWRRVED